MTPTMKHYIKIRKFEEKKNQALAQSKIVTTMGGFIHFCRNTLTQEIISLKVQNSFQIQNNYKIFLETNNLERKIYD